MSHMHIYTQHIETDDPDTITAQCRCGHQAVIPIQAQDRIRVDHIYPWKRTGTAVRVTTIDHCPEGDRVYYKVVGKTTTRTASLVVFRAAVNMTDAALNGETP